ncbi:ribosome maturation factor RimP [Nakamurella deserti]|uniref:ribosome maturation factor RimP n=1 Tax=Nakamurella deserti TaxID=2164074 RepID=UPI000DBE4FCA|nr:ribosome maturation factor RimP [Nakamurella deserti]
MKPADEDALRELARSVVGRVEGLDLEDVVVVAAGRRSLVRVIVDGDHGVTLDAAAEISRTLAAELDAAEEAGTALLGAEPYTLEVTSPGIGRPLTEERHFRRARARLLTVTMMDGTKIEGRARRVVEGTLELLTGTDATVTAVPLGDIRRAKVEVEFGKMPPAHVALLDADGFVDPARAFDEVPADAFTDDELEGDTDDLDTDDEGDDFEDDDTDDLDDDPADTDDTDDLDEDDTATTVDPTPTPGSTRSTSTTEEGQQ